MIKRINDLLAIILLIVVMPGLWIAAGLHLIDLSEVVVGATIAAWTLILQYYFRKKESEPTG